MILLSRAGPGGLPRLTGQRNLPIAASIRYV
jgi:hypothetical protein